MPMSGHSSAEARRRRALAREHIVRAARRTVGVRLSTLAMLCRRWGDAASRRAARAFERSLRSERPQPARWRLDSIIAALTSGASDVDASARRLADELRALAARQQDLLALEHAVEG